MRSVKGSINIAIRFFLFSLFIVVLGITKGTAQAPPPTARNAMYVLGAWGTSNLIASTADFALQQDSDQARAFHAMNLGWASVNLVLAFSGLWKESKAKSLSEEETWRRYQKQKTIFLVNTFLDLGYVGAGAALNLTAQNSKESERNRGFGNAIMYNGAFLFLFDGLTWWQYQKNIKLRMQNKTQGFYWGPSYNGAAFGFRF